MFDDFSSEIDLPMSDPKSVPDNVVYALFATKGDQKTPFYIGQSGRFSERMKDYKRGHHSAPTDFTVKVAIEYLEKNGFKISVRYKTCENFLHKNHRISEEEKVIKNAAESKKWLVNYLPSYFWNAPMNEKELHKIAVETFCKNCIGS
jgi:hypothetical protein